MAHSTILGRNISICYVLLALLLTICKGASASEPVNIRPFPLTGAFTAEFVEDRDHIAIMNFAGVYDTELSSGESNIEARSVVAKEFFRTHPDKYDFLVIFSSFEYDTDDAIALYWGIKNDVQGIGLEQFDYTQLFGSDGKLQGFIDMAAISRYEMDPLKPNFEQVLSIMSHETMHRWGAYVKYMNDSGELSDSLVGHQGAHWSYKLDSSASVMYGADWRDNKDGSFSSEMVRKFYSPLDLYLMGVYEKNEVPPFYVIQNDEIDKNQFPKLNAKITGAAELVTINQIIEAEGERVPGVEGSQKDYRFGFILLKGEDTKLDESVITGLSNIRKEFKTRFAAMTGGRAKAHIYAPVVSEDSVGRPDEVLGGEYREVANISDALNWIADNQTTEGYWEDNESTRLRDTTVGVQVLAEMRGPSTGVDLALNWIDKDIHPENTDFLSRKLQILNKNSESFNTALSKLLDNQNSDGGWGLTEGQDSNPFDTALALHSLLIVSDGNTSSAINKALKFLEDNKNPDGSWGIIVSGPGRINVTTSVLKAFKLLNVNSDELSSSFDWLVSKQKINGSFGLAQGTIHETAQVIDVFIDYGIIDRITVDTAISFISERQDNAGSWNGSVFTTSEALRVLKRFNFANLTVEFTEVTPDSPFDGQPVDVQLRIKNLGNTIADATVLKLYDGNPSAGGVLIAPAADLPIIPPGGSVLTSVSWDTENSPGQHVLYAVVDPDNVVEELAEFDNEASFSIIVKPAPEIADFVINKDEIVITPAKPDHLPAPIGVILQARNIGRVDASGVRVALFDGETLIDEQIVDIPKRSSIAVNLSYILKTPGIKKLRIAVDADNAFEEINEGDNLAEISIETIDTLDFEVTAEDIQIDAGQVNFGDDIKFNITIKNNGTKSTPMTDVKFMVFDGQETETVATQPLQLAAGESTQREVVWRSVKSGNLNFIAEIDNLNNVPESNEDNNAASYPFSVGVVNGPNLTVSHNDLSFNPDPALEGYGVTINALLRNTGNQNASSVKVAFYDGDPSKGAPQIGEDVIVPTLQSGESVSINHIWTKIPDSLDHVVFVVADPANEISEFSEDDNNAFNLLTVKGLPDLSISTNSIRIEPAFPRPGDSVVVSISVQNNGSQIAENFIVRAYQGDPRAGGEQIDIDKIASLNGYEQKVVSFTYTATESFELSRIEIHVDPDNLILEKDEENNTATKQFSIQSADIYVTEPYFSPNDDGIKDHTILAYRLLNSTQLQLSIENEDGDTVFVKDLSESQSGQIQWDGKDFKARVVKDGLYRLKLLNAVGQIVGESWAIVDNNRSSLADSIGTKYEYVKNLTCDYELWTGGDYSEGFMVSENESWIYFPPVLTNPLTFTKHRDLSRMRVDGSGTERIARMNGDEPVADYYSLKFVSPDGKKIAYVSRTDNKRSLFVSDGNGDNAVLIDPEVNQIDAVYISENNEIIYWWREFWDRERGRRVNEYVSAPINSPQNINIILEDVSMGSFRAQYSPDYSKIYIIQSDYSQEPPMVLDVETGETYLLLGNNYMHPEWISLPVCRDSCEQKYNESPWSPTGKYLVQKIVFSRYGGMAETVNSFTQDDIYGIAIYKNSGELLTKINTSHFNGTPTNIRNVTWIDEEKGTVAVAAQVFSDTNDESGIYEFNIHTGESRKIRSLDKGSITGGVAPPMSYHISTWNGSSWTKRGELHFSSLYSTQTLDLEKYLPDADGEYKIRINQVGHEIAAIDQVALYAPGFEIMRPSFATDLKSDNDISESLTKSDNNVFEAHEGNIEVKWDGDTALNNIKLVMTAKEATISNLEVLPLTYPEQADDSYSYLVLNNGQMLIDGKQTVQDTLSQQIFTVYSKPDVGGIYADVSGYITSDSEYLYAALDLTVDNTLESTIDQASIVISSDTGSRTFTVSPSSTANGVVGYSKTSAVTYPHLYYEFKVLLSDIGASSGNVISVKFEAQGSVGKIIDSGTKTVVNGEEQGKQDSVLSLSDYSTLVYVPESNSLIFRSSDFAYNKQTAAIDIKDGSLKPFMEDYRFDFPSTRWQPISEFTKSGSAFFFSGMPLNANPSGCKNNTNFYVLLSLLNMTTDLSAISSVEAGGIVLRGTVADKNFDYYILEYSDDPDSDSWLEIQGPTTESVVDSHIKTWVPPYAGQFSIKLTAYDKAGNSRSEIISTSWNELSQITDLNREPEYFSPNGDGIHDLMNITYRVNTPLHIEIGIYNSNGDRVRNIARDHSTIGELVNVDWDGRDDYGMIVPDGTYRIQIQDFELYVNLDNTFPDIHLIYNEPFSELDQEYDGFISVNPYLDISISDTNGSSIKLEHQHWSGNSDDWTPSYSWVDPNEFKKFDIKEVGSFAHQVSKKWQVKAEDKAGNISVKSTDFAPDRLVLHRITDSVDANLLCEYPPNDTLKVITVSNVYADYESKIPLSVTLSDMNLFIAETVQDTLSYAEIEYRLKGSEGLWESKTLEQYWPLNEQTVQEEVTEVRCAIAPKKAIQKIADHRWFSHVDLGDIEPGREYEVRIKAITDSGSQFYSNVVNIFSKSLKVLNYKFDEIKQMPVISAEHGYGADLKEAQLYISSNKDPRYKRAKVFGVVSNPDQIFEFDATELMPCTEYDAYLIGRTVNGRTVKSSPSTIKTGCMYLEVFEPQPVVPKNLNCGQAHKKLLFEFVFDLFNDSKLTSFVIRNDDGVVLLSENIGAAKLPSPPTSYWGNYDVLLPDVSMGKQYYWSKEIDASSYPQGENTLIATLRNDLGEEYTRKFRVYIDHKLPNIGVSFPVAQQKVCGTPVEFKQHDKSIITKNAVQIRGPLFDESRSALQEYKSDYDNRKCLVGYTAKGELILDDCLTPEYINSEQQSGYYPQRKPFPYRSETFGLYWQPADKPQAWNKLEYPYGAKVGQTGIDTTLGYITDYFGNVNVKLSSLDYGNAKQCASVSFEVDTIVEGAQLDIDTQVISPANQDHSYDEVIVTSSVAEPANLNITIKPAVKIANGKFSITDSVVKQLVTDAYISGGSVDHQWNGTDSAGDWVSDGWYAVVTSFKDGCNLIEEHIEYIEVDNTSPVANITYPTNSGPYPTIIDIVGTVDDKNLDSYSLSYGVGYNPETWAIIGEGSKKVISDSLDSWNSYGLQGEHQLKLIAKDKAANESVVLINLDFQERRDWVSNFGAEPKVFSPNDDDKLDQTSIRYAVTVDSIVSLEIRNLEDELIRSLQDGTETTQGSYALSWDGKDDLSATVDDGNYKVVLSVHLAGDDGNVQIEEYLVKVDNTAPLVVLNRPGEFAEGSGDIIGSVTDASLGNFVVSISEDLPAMQWKDIYSSDQEHSDEKIGSLENYPDGNYVIKIKAIDNGENVTNELISFVIDNTAPEINIYKPAEGEVYSAQNGNVVLEGDIVEDNIEQYTVEYGYGDNPQEWTAITSEGNLPVDAVLAEWNVESVSDGEYTIRVTALDKVGHKKEAYTHLTVDNTPPSIEVSSIVDGGYINGATEIIGTVADNNFKSYEISVATGNKGSSERWTLIGNGEAEVTEGVLWNWGLLPVDGVYTLKINALDLAENSTEKLIELTVDTVPLEAVTELTASAEKSGDLGDVTLSWSSIISDELAGYAVYRNGIRINDVIEESNEFVDFGLPQGEYNYQVSSVDKAGNESELSDSRLITVDFMPPSVEIHTPSADSVISGQINIRGTAKGSNDFKNYQVFLGEGQAPSNWELIKKSSVPAVANDLAQLSTYGLTDGATYSIKLQATDISGNSADTIIAVTVDNQAPDIPTGLAASVNGNTVNLSWNSVDAADLQGYILFRNDKIVNSSGTVIGDITAYALEETDYEDAELHDGDFSYAVAAIDKSGNLSLVSESVEVTLDLRAPQAYITKPDNNIQFDKSLFIKAVSDDTDIASVLFQYQKEGEQSWVDIGSSDLYSPFETVLDQQNLTYGVYKLRAIATDNAGKTDLNASEIVAEYKDISAPATPVGFVYSVDGGSVNLEWQENSENDLAGYHVYRRAENGTQVQITTDPLQDSSYTDSGLQDGVYYYSIKAVDTTGNQSTNFTAEARANIYTPSVIQPYTPRFDSLIEIEGTGEANSTAFITITNSYGSKSTYVEPTDSEGWFLLNEALLETGENFIEIKIEDSVRNQSKALETHVVVAEMLLPPTGLSSVVSGYDVSLDWNDHSDDSVVGYRAYRDGQSVLPNLVPVVVASAESRDQSDGPELSIDRNDQTYWNPLTINTGTERSINGQWLELTIDKPELLTGVDVTWQHSEYIANEYDIQAFDGSVWVTIHQVIGKLDITNSISFDHPYYTDKVRIVLRNSVKPSKYYSRPVRLAEIVPRSVALSETSELEDLVQDGTYKYSVSAVTNTGFETAPSESISVNVGDVTAPEPVTLSHNVFGSEVQLSWTVSNADDLSHYLIFRNDTEIAQANAGVNNFSDTNVINGVYNYLVKPVDAVGNIGEPSNIEVATVQVDVLDPPESLGISLISEGSALLLSWQDSIPVPAEYRVYRSIIPAGPYQLVGTTTESTWLDEGLINESNYYYVVVAVDAIGNESLYSNEVSAAPVDSVSPSSPQLLVPASFGETVTTEKEQIKLFGIAELASKVYLTKDGYVIGETVVGDTFKTKQLPVVSKLISSSGEYVYTDQQGFIIFDSNTETVQELESYPYPGLVRRAGKSDDLIIFAPVNGLFIYSPDGNSLGTLISTTANISWFNYTAPGEPVVIYGYSNGKWGFWAVDPDEQQWTFMHEAVDRYRKPSASVNGSLVAYEAVSPEAGIMILDINSGSTEFIPDTYANTGSEPAWHPDETRLVYRSKENDISVLKQYNRSNGDLNVIINDISEVNSHVVWSPDGSEILYVDSQQRLVRNNLEKGIVNVILDSGETINDFHWTYKNTIVVATDEKTYWFTLPGSYKFSDVELLIGDNIFTAYAFDESGNRSLTSDPMNVIYKGSDYSDLSITESDIKLIPAAPIVGEATKVGVQIHNNGAVTSEESVLTLSVIDSNGDSQVITESTTIPEIPAGMSRTIAFEWQAPEIDGTQLFVAIVDPYDELKEQSEANNMALREVVVTGQGGLSLSLDLVSSSIDIDTNLSGILNLKNNGETFSGRVVITIEDAQGYEVAKLYDQAVEALRYSDSLNTEIMWNSGTTYAGTYQVHMSVFDAAGLLVNELIEPFNINGSSNFDAALSTDKKYYRGNQQVKISGGLVYSTGNQMLEDVTIKLEVISPNQAVLKQEQIAVGALLPNAQNNVSMLWNTGHESIGHYKARMIIEHDGEQIAASETSFDIIPGATQITGELVLSDVVPAAGTDFAADYTIINEGNIEISALPLELKIIDPMTQNEIKGYDAAVDIGINSSVQSYFEIQTNELELQTYGAILQAKVEDEHGFSQTVILNSKFFTVVDRQAPDLSFVAPASGSTTENSVNVQLRAADTLSGVANVSLSVDDGDYVELPIQNASQLIYGTLLSELSAGQHSLKAKAIDAAGNEVASVELLFTVDDSVPEILISGVMDNGYYNYAINPQISIEDPQLATSTITLNGHPFVSGETVSDEGGYNLSVYAVDLAGNESVSQVWFYIDKTPPVIAITGVDNEGLYNNPVQAFIEILEDNPDQTSITLNDEPYESGTVLNNDGFYELQVVTQDRAGNSAQRLVSFTVDMTPPDAPLITQPQNGAVINGNTTDVIGTSEPNARVKLVVGDHIETTIATDNGQFNFGSIPLAEGDNLISVKATDVAGNESDATQISITARIAGDIEIEASVNTNEDSRVLIWIPGWKHPHCPKESDGLIELLEEVLTENNLDHLVVRNEWDFRDALRSQRYNQVIVGDLITDRGGILTISLPTQLELRASVASGTGMTLITTHPVSTLLWRDVFGVRPRGTKGNLDYIDLDDSPASIDGNHVASGFAAKFKLSGGVAVGELHFKRGRHRAFPGLVLNTYGNGPVAIMPFNPDKIVERDSAKKVIMDVVKYTTPTQGILLPGSMAMVNWQVNGITEGSSIKLLENAKSPLSVVWAGNEGEILDANTASWAIQSSKEQESFQSLIQLPDVAGSYGVNAELFLLGDGNPSSLGEGQIDLITDFDQSGLGVRLMDALNNMETNNYFDEFKRQVAMTYVQYAITKEQNFPADAEYSIGMLINAEVYLILMRDKHPEVVALLGDLLRTYQARAQ